MLRRDDDLRLLVVFRLRHHHQFGRDDSRLLDARDARFSSVTSVSKLLALLLLLLLLLFVACALKKCRRRFDASVVRKVNKTLALKASLFGTQKVSTRGA